MRRRCSARSVFTPRWLVSCGTWRRVQGWYVVEQRSARFTDRRRSGRGRVVRFDDRTRPQSVGHEAAVRYVRRRINLSEVRYAVAAATHVTDVLTVAVCVLR